MEGSSGGRFVEGKLQELREALDTYFGALNQAKEGLFLGEIPDKPEALKKLEQCESLGIPLVSGGVMDQPHVWLLEMGVVIDTRKTFEMLESVTEE